MRKVTLVALFAIVAGFGLQSGKPLQAGQRPFHFSRDTDTTKPRVMVDEGNRMIDDIYRQFDGNSGLIKVAGYQFLMMRLDFDSVSSSSAMHLDTFTCRDTEDRVVKFDSDPIRQIHSSTLGRWNGGIRVAGGGLGFARFLTDSTFVAGAWTQNCYDTLSVVIIGRQK